MKMPLITIFMPSVHGGGAERAMLVFGGQLVQLGLEVDLVLANREGALSRLIPPSIQVVDLKSPRMIRAIPGLTRYFRARRPAAIFSTITHANIAAVWAARHAQVSAPVIVRQSNAPISETKGSWGRFVTSCVLPYVYGLADGVIAVSDGVRDELVLMNPKLKTTVKVLPTPILTNEILRQAEQEPRLPWFDDPSTPVILSAGRLKTHKGMVEIVRAFARIRERTRAKLVILGEGDDRPRIEAEIERLGLHDEVALPGFIANPFPYMRRAQVFVLASVYEGLPNVLVQALALGTPVVATNCRSGPAEILEYGRWGRLVSVGSVPELAEAIETSLSLPREVAGQQSVWARFGALSSTLNYLEFAGVDTSAIRGFQVTAEMAVDRGGYG